MFRSEKQSGFTLAEAMIATVILGFAAASLLTPFTSGAVLRADGERSTLASKLASDLMEEIAGSSFESIISLYNGLSEDSGQIKDTQGNVFSDSRYAGFSRKASCEYVYVPQQSGNAAADFILVTVNVFYKTEMVISLKQLISKY